MTMLEIIVSFLLNFSKIACVHGMSPCNILAQVHTCVHRTDTSRWQAILNTTGTSRWQAILKPWWNTQFFWTFPHPYASTRVRVCVCVCVVYV